MNYISLLKHQESYRNVIFELNGYILLQHFRNFINYVQCELFKDEKKNVDL